MNLASQASSPLSSACRVGAILLIGALLACGPLASAADMVWVGGDSFNSSNFTNSGNWQNNTQPSWGTGNSLKFSQNLNSNVTGLNYNYGDWRDANDIYWDTTFTVSRTLQQTGGGGIRFTTRIENNSSYAQTAAMNLSGGQNGASDIQLNPVKGSLILSGTIYNDNSLDYTVYGSDTATVTTLTLNTELGPNAPNKPNVDFTVAGGRNSNVQVNASQSWAGTTTVNSGAFTTANGVTLASSAIVVAGGTVATTSANTFADTATLTVNSGRLSIGGSDTVASLAGTGGTVDLAAGTTLTAGDAGATSYAGSITGSGGFTKVGSGALTLSGNNSYGGGALVSQGALVGGASTSFGNGSVVLGDGNTGTSSIVLMANSSGNTTIANAITVANLGTGLVSIGGTNTGSSSANAWTGTLTLNRNVQVFGDTTPGSSGRTSFLGQITGSGGITVTQGRVTLQNGTNNFTGPVVVNSGATLQLDVNNGLNEVIPNSAAVTVNGALNFASGGGTETIGSLAGSGTVSSVVSGNYSLVVGGSTNTTFSGVITSGSGVIGLTKSGAGTLLLTGSNGFTGGSSLNGGTLGVGSANALGSSGTISFGGGTLQYSASNTTDYSGRFSNAASQQYSIDTNGQNVTLGSNLTSSGGSFTKLGAGDVTLSGTNSYGGGTVVSAGRLVGTTTSLQGAITNNAAVEFAQAASGTYAGSMTGSGSLTKSGAGTMTLSGSNSYAGGSTVSAGRLVGTTASLQGAITNNAEVEFAQATSGTYAGSITGSGSLTKSGVGAILLTGSNGFTGGAALNAGTLAVGSANALGSSGTISFGGGTLQYSASNTTDYSGRFSNAASQQYSIDTNGQNVTLAASLTSSGGSFTKLGGGNLILSGSSTFSGPTTVSAGRLSVNGSLGNTAVTVQSGAEVGGSGAIGGVVNVLAGGTLSPGNSIQSLAVAATTFSGSSTFKYEYDSTNPASLAAAADLLVVNGNLTINSGAILTLTDLASSKQPFVNYSTNFALINYAGAWNGGLFTYNGTELADGVWFLVGSQEWQIDYNRSSSAGLANFTGDYLPSSSFVAITAVPEPSTWALALAGLAAAGFLIRRRRFKN